MARRARSGARSSFEPSSASTSLKVVPRICRKTGVAPENRWSFWHRAARQRSRIGWVNGSQPGQARRFRLEWLAVCVFLSVIGLVIVVALYRELVRTEALEADHLQVQA